MKAKRILITYLNNGNLKSQVAKEFIFHNVVRDLMSEGRIVSNTVMERITKITSFEDGTKVWLMPFGQTTVGMRFTHLYVDEVASQIPKANEIIDEVYKASVVRGDYINFDTSDENRMFTFSYEDSKIILKNI